MDHTAEERGIEYLTHYDQPAPLRAAMVRTVASHAHDPNDCATLLDMLGLDPKEATA